MRKTNRPTHPEARLAMLVLLFGLAAACAPGASPPAPDKYLGTLTQGGYLFLRWQEGLEVMIWWDLGSAADRSVHSAGSRDGLVYREQGSARAADGQTLSWHLQTSDGQSGNIQLGRSTYDLTAGNLFVITSQGGSMEVRQLSRDLSGVPLDQEGILSFAESDPDLSVLLSGASGLPPASTPAVATAPQLEATLEAPASLLRGEPVLLEFTLTNRSQVGIYALQWYTPLEGILGEIFRVKRDGQTVPYEGPLVSRGAPTPEEYVYLEGGASALAAVDLAEVYDFSQPGTYTVTFQAPRISHVARNKDDMATSVDELHPVDMPSNPLEIVIEGP